LNQGNGRSVNFHKELDFEAFAKILAEGIVRYACRILSDPMMPNQLHFVLQPTEDLMPITTQRARGMFTKADTRVFPSRMTFISMFSFGTSNAMHGVNRRSLETLVCVW